MQHNKTVIKPTRQKELVELFVIYFVEVKNVSVHVVIKPTRQKELVELFVIYFVEVKNVSVHVAPPGEGVPADRASIRLRLPHNRNLRAIWVIHSYLYLKNSSSKIHPVMTFIKNICFPVMFSNQ